MQLFETPDEAASGLADPGFLSAEFMYQPPPRKPRARTVFEYALRSRLSTLSGDDAVIFICDSEDTATALGPIAAEYPAVRAGVLLVNPQPAADTATPARLGWDGAWRRYETTDRWSRIAAAMQVARRLTGPGWLVMPANDAVWSAGLLERLAMFGEEHRRGGLPAAASPYTPYQHSDVPGADVPPLVIGVLNTAFGRDSQLRGRLARDEAQGFWGKTGLMPYAMCGAVIDAAEQTTFEDDLELDRVIRELGYAARALWVDDPAVYRQALPVFDLDGVRRVIERTMHYSLNVPATDVGGSTLNFPLDAAGEARQRTDPTFARYNAVAEGLIAEAAASIKARLDRYGASWVDWGRYRYVVRPGQPDVEVWGRADTTP